MQNRNERNPWITPNPITPFNPVSIFPAIHASAYISPSSSIIGDVTMGENCYVAPNVCIRADEGTPFFIGANTNLQEGVTLHGVLNKRINVAGKGYSIFVGEGVTVAHRALLHGPCYVGNHVFVGFNAMVYGAIIEEGAFISYNALISDSVIVAANRFVPPAAIIDTQRKADALQDVPRESRAFAKNAQRVNRAFPTGYHSLY